MYELRRLTAADAPAVHDLLESSPGYTLRISGHPPSPDDATEILSAAPPGITGERKVDLGLFDGPVLVGVADVLRGYPAEHQAYIGLLLVRGDRHGHGLGRRLHDHVLELVQTWPEVSTLRLGVVETNAASAVGFWEALGYEPTGETAPYENGAVRCSVVRYERPVPKG
ncbi:GNAT family N-acetyltransferase [Glutamicibacter protophormiae]|uniref:GNAT family N-acetyltransferase n=1 Tax=unclassified Kocuria TaxID=2649579 RepID=UPI000F88968A|nr:MULTISPECIES: GNAT family N-acetyltransferase [unclassified Kocuria]RUP85189.1 GNAT family N-acetyltransferase [Kocuria sp. HSID17590]RUQ10654.1 GNAT family N-acetyltransferase [Kocuria sp. HSID17582]WNB88358.1 GNAT family N-acetyltransferase [Glutamicibacter protophormiae]